MLIFFLTTYLDKRSNGGPDLRVCCRKDRSADHVCVSTVSVPGPFPFLTLSASLLTENNIQELTDAFAELTNMAKVYAQRVSTHYRLIWGHQLTFWYFFLQRRVVQFHQARCPRRPETHICLCITLELFVSLCLCA